jgi:hypothetical protein
MFECELADDDAINVTHVSMLASAMTTAPPLFGRILGDGYATGPPGSRHSLPPATCG